MARGVGIDSFVWFGDKNRSNDKSEQHCSRFVHINKKVLIYLRNYNFVGFCMQRSTYFNEKNVKYIIYLLVMEDNLMATNNL